MTNILIGADPELFMKSAEGSFVSAHGQVPGTKHEPYKVPFGAIQIDGTALEFNIDPASTLNEFVDNIKSVKATIESYVPGYNVVAEPVATYDLEYFKYEIPPQAKELGCDPDFNAWTLDVNPRPKPGNLPIRTGAGHIHIGWTTGEDIYDKDHFELCAKIARQMDYYLGIYSLKWDSNSVRRSLYGKAGAMRPKSYGVEYRVLSNSWLNSEHLMKLVYNQAVQGVTDGFNGNWVEDKWRDTAVGIINNSETDWDKVHSIFPDQKLEMMS